MIAYINGQHKTEHIYTRADQANGTYYVAIRCADDLAGLVLSGQARDMRHVADVLELLVSDIRAMLPKEVASESTPVA